MPVLLRCFDCSSGLSRLVQPTKEQATPCSKGRDTRLKRRMAKQVAPSSKRQISLPDYCQWAGNNRKKN